MEGAGARLCKRGGDQLRVRDHSPTPPLPPEGRFRLPSHPLPAALGRKTAALDQAAPLQEGELPEALDTMRRLLESRMGQAGFVQVLWLLETFRLEEPQSAVKGNHPARGAELRHREAPGAASGWRGGPSGNTSSCISTCPMSLWQRRRKRLHGTRGRRSIMSEKVTVLLEHHLKEMERPTLRRE